MAAYIYKVTAETVTLDDGSKANLAKYAYKEFYGGYGIDADAMNEKAYNESRCYLAEKFVKESPNYTGRVVMDREHTCPFEAVAITANNAAFSDYWFDAQVEKRRTEALDNICMQLCGYTWAQFCDMIKGDYTPSVDARLLSEAQLKLLCKSFKNKFGREPYVYGR